MTEHMLLKDAVEDVRDRDGAGAGDRPTRRRGWLVRRMLLLADVLGLSLALVIAELLFARGSLLGAEARTELLIFLLTLPGWIVIAKLYGLYDRDEERADHSTVDEIAGVFHLVTVGTILFFGGARLAGATESELAKLLVFATLAIALVTLERAAARSFCRRQVAYVQNTVIVGAGPVGQLVARKLLQHPEYGINVVGFVDSDPTGPTDPAHLRIIGPPERLPDVVRLYDVERVVFAFSNHPHSETLELIRSVKDLDVQIDIVPHFYETMGPNVGVHLVEGVAIVSLPPLRLSGSSLLLKRTMDIVLSVFGLLVLAPFFMYVALRIKLDSSGPVFYRHDRIGRHGQPFRLYKFRTMNVEHCRGADYGGDEAEREFQRLMADPLLLQSFEQTYKLPDDPRVTRFGRFLRRTSLDELPQLFNVIAGHISLVGPRPITTDELARYGRDANALLSVWPGMTGYWQINGRSNVSYDERVRLDIAYATSWSLKLDLSILFKTMRVLWAQKEAH